jgi:hypothetical protein
MFKLHELLSRRELDALEEFASRRRRTTEDCRKFLARSGFTVRLLKVGEWKRAFDAQRKSQTPVTRCDLFLGGTIARAWRPTLAVC